MSGNLQPQLPQKFASLEPGCPHFTQYFDIRAPRFRLNVVHPTRRADWPGLRGS
jgi:hypothetical protein